MSRAEKIIKLGNAIRSFRGSAFRTKWIRSPQPHRAHNVVKWLHALGHQPELIKAEMELICAFQSQVQLDAWLQKLGGAA
jgi:hypothetical protein